MPKVDQSRESRIVFLILGLVLVLGFVAAAMSVTSPMSQSSASVVSVSRNEPGAPANAVSAATQEVAIASATQPRRTHRGASFMINPRGMVDRSWVVETADGLRTGKLDRCALESGAPARIVLNDTAPRSFPREGEWTTDIVKTEIPFTEFVPYWNADVPADCGISVEASLRDRETGKWSAWLFAGDWGRTVPAEHVEHFEGGDLVEDNWQLTRAADAFALRVHFDSYSLEAKNIPDLRRLGVLYSGVMPVDEAKKLNQPTPEPEDWVRDLPVPYRAQGDTPPNLSYQTCSPTSVSMVLSYWGVDLPTTQNALAIYDAEHELFGNWNHAVQYAASLGLDAWLKRFRNWNQVKAEIARGTPVVASIRFNAGEFPSEVLKSSKGHLIVVRGFTADGDAICNDPGKRAVGKDVVYKANELAHAWFDKGGVGYVIRGAQHPAVVVTAGK